MLERAPALSLTYSEVGATLTGPPPDAHRLTRVQTIGRGRPFFERAVEALFSFEANRRAGLQVTSETGRAVIGSHVVSALGPDPLGVLAPCRIVLVVEESDRCGFAYGTLAGHPESGEEYFEVSLVGNGPEEERLVQARIEAFTRPAWTIARWGAPLAYRVQSALADRYLEGLRRAGGSIPS